MRDILASLEIEELSPRSYAEYCTAAAGDVLESDVLIHLRCIRAHLELKQGLSSVHGAVADDDVVGLYALASAGHAAAGGTVEEALFHEYGGVRSVHRVLVCPRSLAALEAYGIVVDSDAAAFHVHVGTYVKVYAVGTCRAYRSDRREDSEIIEFQEF